MVPQGLMLTSEAQQGRGRGRLSLRGVGDGEVRT